MQSAPLTDLPRPHPPGTPDAAVGGSVQAIGIPRLKVGDRVRLHIPIVPDWDQQIGTVCYLLPTGTFEVRLDRKPINQVGSVATVDRDQVELLVQERLR